MLCRPTALLLLPFWGDAWVDGFCTLGRPPRALTNWPALPKPRLPASQCVPQSCAAYHAEGLLKCREVLCCTHTPAQDADLQACQGRRALLLPCSGRSARVVRRSVSDTLLRSEA